jgi:hypothetical protein
MGPEDTPAEVFKECLFDSFVENAQTTSKVLDSTLDLRTKVSLTILKKFTSNAAREGRSLPFSFSEGSIIRQGEWCRKGLTLLARDGLVFRSKAHDGMLGLPVGSHSVRVPRILVAPSRTVDALGSKSALIS